MRTSSGDNIGERVKGKLQGTRAAIVHPGKCLRRRGIHNFLWQLISVWDYSNAERMLAAKGMTLLLVNLESMTTKSRAAGAVEKAVHYFLHTAKVTTEFYTD